MICSHNMIKELDTIVLTHDIGKYGLEKGDIGAVVHCYADGRSIAVLTLNMNHIRLMSGTEILHVREVSRQAG